MQIDVQQYLELAELGGKIVFWDLETTGLKGDLNSILVSSFKEHGKPPFSINVEALGNDQKVARETKEILESYQTVVTYYGKGFDMPMLNTRLAKWKRLPVQPMYHLDMYFSLKPKFLLARKGLGSVGAFLGAVEDKMFVGSDVWSEMGFKMKTHMPVMIKRCESDVILLEDVYNKSKHFIRDLKRG